ncbi:protein-disulfide reductase DsbD family protein [Marinibaculum pumilum]|uniref:Protein-disulfide reductase DsbD family protein n=1 Tax=Marinibaculum pumilum TaxID=1766165 RepID=A0ABV7L3Y6_9PROT
MRQDKLFARPTPRAPAPRISGGRRLLGAVAALCAVLLAALPSPAATDGQPPGKVAASLIAEPAAIAAGEPFWVSLRQDIAPEWHTYWRNPGDSGQATYIDWTLPPGFRAEPIAWPVPERVPYGPLMNFGYEGRVDLLVRIHPPEDLPPGRPVTLQAEAEWLVCADVCIPEYGSFDLTLPVAAEPAPPTAARQAAFHAARAALPSPSPWPVGAALDNGQLRLAFAAPQLAAALRAGGDTAIADGVFSFFPDSDGVIVNAAPQVAMLDGDTVVLRTEAAANAGNGAGAALSGLLVAHMPPQDGAAGKPVVQGFTFETALQAGPGNAAVPAGAGGDGGAGRPGAPAAPAQGGLLPDALAGVGLLEALLLALAGGIILNLMPCVFPVIAMKALGLAQKGGAARSAIRMHGLAYAAGVLVTFAAIGGALLLVKAGGAAVGWGFQLQSPVFVALMAYLMLAVGLNLSGLFTVGEGLMGLGQGRLSGSGGGPGHAGAFLTGVLASAVAAPCTAPFMATAIGFALTRSPPVALAVLLAVGLGMALPYLLLTWVPGALRFLPRPGAWMERLRQVLAFPMYAAAAWLVWVLSQQAGPTGVIVVLGGAVLLAFGFWLWQLAKSAGQAGGRRPAWRLAGGGAAVLALAGAVALTFSLRPPDLALQADAAAAGEARTGSGPAWERYSPARLQALQADGRPVFVNFTAAWCITCKVNEQVALSSASMRELFEAGNVAYLKGDWTNQDPEITRMLERFGRSGVPLYVLFAPDGSIEVLPQILTEAGVAAALRRLPGGAAADRAGLDRPAIDPDSRLPSDRPDHAAGADHA